LKISYKISALACAAVCIILPVSCRAGIVYTDLLPGSQYDCCSGYVAADPDPLAAAFTPTQSYLLSEIDVGVWNSTTPFAFTLSLDQDSGGHPGSAIESWSVTSVVAPSSGLVTIGPSTGESVLDILNITLMPNVQYWVEIGSPTAVYWNVNNLGPGPVGTLAGYNAGEWFVTNNHSEPPAFEVLGTAIPEPNAALPCGLVLLGLSGIRFVSRFADRCLI
jgi:hypothetical protein